jgi:hypothetical protein
MCCQFWCLVAAPETREDGPVDASQNSRFLYKSNTDRWSDKADKVRCYPIHFRHFGPMPTPTLAVIGAVGQAEREAMLKR